MTDEALTITAFFTRLGVPQEGLDAVIKIRDVETGALIVSESAMSEIGDGWYKYVFTTGSGYDATGSYVFRCDGGPSLASYPAERYTWGSNEIEDNVFNKTDRANYASGTFGQALKLVGDIEGGNWIISGTTQVFYDRVNSGTVVAEFELRDEFGVPTVDAPFQRIRKK